MDFITFKSAFKTYKIFSIKDIEKEFPGFNKMNLVRWQKKDWIKKIRNKWYHFTKPDFSETDLFYIANKIYAPSYISLESAFSYYGIIPEAVFTITSISTKKTERFLYEQKNFRYTKIKKELFFGYKLVVNNGFTFKIASLEKALLDYLYANAGIKSMQDFQALRLNKTSIVAQIDLEKMMEYSLFFKSKVLLKKVLLLKKFLDVKY